MKTQVMIVGGYGTVGRAVSELLAQDPRIGLVIAGRNEAKARELARQLQAGWRVIDIADSTSIAPALQGIDVVINCFSGPFTHAPLHLPERCAMTGIHYLDVSGSDEYTGRFLQLNDPAIHNGATLITALGANPGIPGIAIMSAKGDFEVLESGKVVFVLGAKMEGISASSLMELKHMFAVKPLVWEQPHWVKAGGQSLKEYVGEPFEREVYVGASLTRDLLAIPDLTGIGKLSFWSGSQFAGQGLAMILGIQLGLAGSYRSAQFLLKILKRMGQGQGATSDVLIKTVIVGKKAGVRQTCTIAVYGEENTITALAPAIVCQQMIEKKIARCGAFVPPEIVPAGDFIKRLEQSTVHFSSTTEGL